MADYRLSRLADLDVAGIAEFSVRRFGLVKARRYRDELTQCFSRLAEQPEIGRRAGHLGAGLRRYLLGKHIVYYQRTEAGILVVRVLHSRMEAVRHFVNPEDTGQD